MADEPRCYIMYLTYLSETTPPPPFGEDGYLRAPPNQPVPYAIKIKN